MARYYTALGPFESREIAERARAGMTESDALRASVLRLRDRTGPSVVARLAALEAALSEPLCIGCGKSRAAHDPAADAPAACQFLAVAEHLEHLTREHAALVQRVSDLEGPRLVPYDTVRVSKVAVGVAGAPDGEPRDSLREPREGDWFVDGDDGCVTEITGSDDSGISLRRLCPFGSVTTVRGAYRARWSDLCAVHRTRPMTPAEVAAFKADGTRPGKAARTVDAEDVPEWCRDLMPSAAAPDPTPEQIEAYLRGSAGWTASRFDAEYWTYFATDGTRHHVHKSNLADIAHTEGLTPAEMRARILASSSTTADPDRLAKGAEPTDEDLDRRFGVTYATACEAGRHATAHLEGRRDLYNLGREHGRADADAAIDMLRGKAEEAEVSGLAYVCAAKLTAHVPDGETRDPTATLTEAEMAAELLAAGYHLNQWWNPRPDGALWYHTTADAYAAMRAAKGAPAAATEPSLSEKEAFLRSKGWTNEEPYGWHCPGIEGTSDTHKAYALAKGAK